MRRDIDDVAFVACQVLEFIPIIRMKDIAEYTFGPYTGKSPLFLYGEPAVATVTLLFLHGIAERRLAQYSAHAYGARLFQIRAEAIYGAD